MNKKKNQFFSLIMLLLSLHASAQSIQIADASGDQAKLIDFKKQLSQSTHLSSLKDPVYSIQTRMKVSQVDQGFKAHHHQSIQVYFPSHKASDYAKELVFKPNPNQQFLIIRNLSLIKPDLSYLRLKAPQMNWDGREGFNLDIPQLTADSILSIVIEEESLIATDENQQLLHPIHLVPQFFNLEKHSSVQPDYIEFHHYSSEITYPQFLPLRFDFPDYMQRNSNFKNDIVIETFEMRGVRIFFNDYLNPHQQASKTRALVISTENIQEQLKNVLDGFF